MNKFSKVSRERLDTCHDLLQILMTDVLEEMDISILCGHRTAAEQNRAYEDGFSKVQFPNSKHNSLPSMAVDVAPFPVRWNDTARWKKLGEVVWKCWLRLPISERAGYRLVWGGDWKLFKDSPHFEIVKD